MQEDVLSLPQTCALARCAWLSAWNAIHRGELVAVQVSGRWLVRRAEAERWAEAFRRRHGRGATVREVAR